MATPPKKPAAPKAAAKPQKPIIPPATAKQAETLASKGMRAPSTLSSKEVQTLAAEVMRHIEPRKGGKP